MDECNNAWTVNIYFSTQKMPKIPRKSGIASGKQTNRKLMCDDTCQDICSKNFFCIIYWAKREVNWWRPVQKWQKIHTLLMWSGRRYVPLHMAASCGAASPQIRRRLRTGTLLLPLQRCFCSRFVCFLPFFHPRPPSSDWELFQKVSSCDVMRKCPGRGFGGPGVCRP